MLGSLVLAAGVAAAQGQPSSSPMPASTHTRVVLLGTGTPGPDPDRSGPATAIVVGDTAYLVDFGPGVVRRASAAMKLTGIGALEPTKLRVAFVTHLHSDHTVGYPDLIFTPWTVGRRVPLEVYGPKGIKAMTDHILTTTPQLAELAQAAKPRLLIVYHYSSVAPEDILNDMLARYPGHVVIGRDLDVY